MDSIVKLREIKRGTIMRLLLGGTMRIVSATGPPEYDSRINSTVISVVDIQHPTAVIEIQTDDDHISATELDPWKWEGKNNR